MREDRITASEMNYGIAIMKTMMCFAVVLRHFWANCSHEKIYEVCFPLTELAVPVFMMLSFYLSGRIFNKIDLKGTMRTRIWKLYKPWIVWSIVIWIFYEIIDIIFKTDLVRITDFLWQIFTGANPNVDGVFWFQFVLISLNFLFFLVCYLCPETKSKIFFGFLLISLVGQYTQWDVLMWSNARFELQHSIGMIMEMIPFAVLGWGFYELKMPDKLGKRFIIPLAISFILCMRFKEFFPVANGIWYSGLYILVIALISMMIMFCIPFCNVNDKMKQLINVLSKYTLGIYCIHRVVGFYYNVVFSKLGFEIETFSMCVLIYVTCYCMCAVIDHLPFSCTRGIV